MTVPWTLAGACALAAVGAAVTAAEAAAPINRSRRDGGSLGDFACRDPSPFTDRTLHRASSWHLDKPLARENVVDHVGLPRTVEQGVGRTELLELPL